LRGLIANRNKGATLTKVPKAQVSANLPLPPPTDLGLRINPDLKKKIPIQVLEERGGAPSEGHKADKAT